MEKRLRDIAPAGLKLIETLRFDPAQGFLREARHLRRLVGSAQRLQIDARPDRIAATLAQVPRDQGVLRVRLTLDLEGQTQVSWAALGPSAPHWTLALAPQRLDSADPWLSVKTTQRALYDQTRAALPPGCDEVIFLNQHAELCEGTITNIFLRRDGLLLTPPLSAGLLPGILREELLETGRAREASLTLPDLQRAEALFVGNALRGLIPAQLA